MSRSTMPPPPEGVDPPTAAPLGLTPDPVAHIPPLQDESLTAAVGMVMFEISRVDRLARENKFGGLHTMPGGPDLARLAVLVEEVGEVARELNEQDIAGADRRRELLTREMVQVAAVAVSWVAAILEDRP